MIQEVVEPAPNLAHTVWLDATGATGDSCVADRAGLFGHRPCRFQQPKSRPGEPDMVRPIAISRGGGDDDYELGYGSQIAAGGVDQIDGLSGRTQ